MEGHAWPPMYYLLLDKRLPMAEAMDATSRHSSKNETYAALSESSRVPASTLWHRKYGRPSKKEVTAQKQYLTPSEENALADYVLHMAQS
jgi:hypothetical protein